MSDTPRTDAFENTCGDYEKAHNYARRLAEFTRAMERELNVAHKLIGELRVAQARNTLEDK